MLLGVPVLGQYGAKISNVVEEIVPVVLPFLVSAPIVAVTPGLIAVAPAVLHAAFGSK